MQGGTWSQIFLAGLLLRRGRCWSYLHLAEFDRVPPHRPVGEDFETGDGCIYFLELVCVPSHRPVGEDFEAGDGCHHFLELVCVPPHHTFGEDCEAGDVSQCSPSPRRV